MFFSRNSATSDDDESTSSFPCLSLSHDNTPISSSRSDPISSSATSFSVAPTLLIASSDEPTFSFRGLSFSDDDTPLCWSCNAVVHSPNCHVARHVRCLACASCRPVDSGRCFSGPSAPDPSPIPVLCPFCRPTDPPAPPPPPPPPPPPSPPPLTTTSSASASLSSSYHIPAISIFMKLLFMV